MNKLNPSISTPPPHTQTEKKNTEKIKKKQNKTKPTHITMRNLCEPKPNSESLASFTEMETRSACGFIHTQSKTEPSFSIPTKGEMDLRT
jgi:hypothetical protein